MPDDYDDSDCVDGNGDPWPEHDDRGGYGECRRCGAELPD